MNPLEALEADIQAALKATCTVCNARPGEMCASMVNANKARETPHFARFPDQLEAARAKRVELEWNRSVESVKAHASSALRSLPDGDVSEQVTGLALAVCRLADAHGCSREDLIKAFSKVAREFPITAVAE